MYVRARSRATELLRANHVEVVTCIIQSSTTSLKILLKYANRNKPNLAPFVTTFTNPTTQLAIVNNLKRPAFLRDFCFCFCQGKTNTLTF